MPRQRLAVPRRHLEPVVKTSAVGGIIRNASGSVLYRAGADDSVVGRPISLKQGAAVPRRGDGGLVRRPEYAMRPQHRRTRKSRGPPDGRATARFSRLDRAAAIPRRVFGRPTKALALTMELSIYVDPTYSRATVGKADGRHICGGGRGGADALRNHDRRRVTG